MKNKRGWIRIVEAFTAVLLVTGFLLVVIDKGYVDKQDISKEVYEKEFFILKQIQSNSSLRNSVLNVSSFPMKWEDFPDILKNKINNELPVYLHCQAKICEINKICVLNESDNELVKNLDDKDVYVKSVIIASNLTTYSPRKLKLFCWVDYSPKTEEEPPEQTCAEAGGNCIDVACNNYENCVSLDGVCDEGLYCCSGDCSIPEELDAASLNLEFDDVVYSWNGTDHFYTHTRTFTESNGVGVNLTMGQLCLQSIVE